MQYSIPLPLNFHAEQIRARVEARRGLFDDHAGLLHKSFIYSEQDHLYAPFYVWKDAAAARDFLLDDLFKGVVDTFSRHRVRSWIVLSMVYGNKSIEPGFARREIDPVPVEQPLKLLRENERRVQEEKRANPGLYMQVSALDADRWEIMRYSLWESAAQANPSASDCVQEYGVLHVSEPAA